MRLRVRILAVLVVCAAALAGCSGEKQDSCLGNQTLPGVDGGLVCGQPFDLNETDSNGNYVGPGTFGVKVVEYVHVTSAGIVDTDTISILLYLTDIDYHPDRLEAELDVQLCQIQIPEVQIPGQPKPTQFLALPQLLPNMARIMVPARFTGTTTCESFQSDPAVSIYGCCLDDALNDDLPSDPVGQACSGPFDIAEKDTYCDTRSGCMYDVDLDGYPAATLKANNVPAVEIDVVLVTMRSWIAMNGLVATSDMILGTATFGLVTNPFGCRIVPIGGGDVRDCNQEELRIVSQISPKISQVEGQESTFLAVRVDPSIDCQELIERELEIFGR